MLDGTPEIGQPPIGPSGDVGATTAAGAPTWWAVVVGWAALLLLFVAGLIGNASGTPPFPTRNAFIALVAFWFVLVLFLNALFGLIQLVTLRADWPLFRKWWLPFPALVLGLAIARWLWS